MRIGMCMFLWTTHLTRDHEALLRGPTVASQALNRFRCYLVNTIPGLSARIAMWLSQLLS
jgi:hypothetical protein